MVLAAEDGMLYVTETITGNFELENKTMVIKKDG